MLELKITSTGEYMWQQVQKLRIIPRQQINTSGCYKKAAAVNAITYKHIGNAVVLWAYLQAWKKHLPQENAVPAQTWVQHTVLEPLFWGILHRSGPPQIVPVILGDKGDRGALWMTLREYLTLLPGNLDMITLRLCKLRKETWKHVRRLAMLDLKQKTVSGFHIDATKINGWMVFIQPLYWMSRTSHHSRQAAHATRCTSRHVNLNFWAAYRLSGGNASESWTPHSLVHWSSKFCVSECAPAIAFGIACLSFCKNSKYFTSGMLTWITCE